MCFPRFGLLLCLLLLNDSVGAQQGPSTPSSQPQPIQKDAAALAILGQMAAATGWNNANLPADLVASGTMTVYASSDSQVFSVTYKLKGTTQSISELTAESGTSKTISNGKNAATVLPDGTVSPLPSYLARTMRQMVFPFMTQISSYGGSDISIASAGTRQISGSLCNGVSVAHQLSRTDPLAYIEDLASPMTIWISATTGLPAQVDYVLTGIDNFKAIWHLSRTFSDYRQVNGIAIPFHQEEATEGQRTIVLDITSVQLNSGLTDGDFYVPAAQGGR